jgi:hypothetical protein
MQGITMKFLPASNDTHPLINRARFDLFLHVFVRAPRIPRRRASRAR